MGVSNEGLLIHPYVRAQVRGCWGILTLVENMQTLGHFFEPLYIVPEEYLDHVLDIITTLWTEKTKETYGTSLLVFHIYCDLNSIPDSLRCPISQTLLSTFLASCTGAYSGMTLSNFAASLHAWHILHKQPWITNQDKLHCILKGASRLMPTTSKHPKCLPFKHNNLLLFLTYLDLQSPRNAAIFTCITTTFYSVSHLKEFTVPALKKISPATHITTSHLPSQRS